MKPQDLLFIIALAVLMYKRNPMWLVVGGVVFVLLSIPLFQLQIFFTAQRLVMYAAAFLLAAVILLWFKKGK